MQKRRYFSLCTPEQAILSTLSNGGLVYEELVSRAQRIVNVSPGIYRLVLERLVVQRQLQRQDNLYRLFPAGEYRLAELPDGGDAA